ncbi:MAG: 50S ribosomal protein L7/L12 [Thermoguttaceae bacterium]|jgi:large subunit ribosomal protein L7/L12|nr:50S ribosomal protein L7/L12 [Thermoguttaceae bacterium]MBR4751008.1 50S ribosomal protein L7/L12 [Thermoguttaceae bacterium]MBR5760365.1 50S ribosomal protein L7/L12 [Thermoguttaceae bacterium]
MSEERVFSDEIKAMGDKIMGMTLKDAKELSDYLKEEYGVEPAAGGAVMVAGPAAGADAAPAAEEKTEFDVVLEGFDAAKKIGVIKVVRTATGASLGDAKGMVEGAPKAIKTGLPKDEAEKLKKELEDAGAKVSLK